jgi:Tol biopolymer transport system component
MGMPRRLSWIVALVALAVPLTALNVVATDLQPRAGTASAEPAKRAAKRDGALAYFYTSTSGKMSLRLLGDRRTRTLDLSFPLDRGCCASPAMAWSPSGKFLAIATGGDRNAIWIVNAKGTHERPITPANGNFFEDIAWSPNGRFIAYAESDFRHPADAHAGIYRARADGVGAPERLVNARTYAGRPAWSPDGSRIAFTQQLTPGDVGVWVMKPNGSAKERVFTVDEGCWAPAEPKFTADGESLVFEAEHLVGARCKSGVMKVGTDGTGLTTITAPGPRGVDVLPQPAPRGDRVVFCRDDAHGVNSLMTTIKGASPSTVGSGCAIAWSPSGKWLILTKSPNRYFLVHPTGDGLKTLFTKAARAYFPAWQPR